MQFYLNVFIILAGERGGGGGVYCLLLCYATWNLGVGLLI